MLTQTLLSILLLLLMASTEASFLNFYPSSIRKANLKESIDSADLANLIRSQAAQHDGVFSNAIQLLESMKSSPSCSRIAAMKLLTSCQSLSSSEDASGAHIAHVLDRVKSIYAARLALCELSGAGVTIPLSCSSIRIAAGRLQNDSAINLMDIADDFPAPVVEGCLRGLESRPQWWTSYSNSRQNAILICQAARIEIEKEEMLNLHQSLTKNVENLNSALQSALHDAFVENAQQKAFMEEVQKLRNRLIGELENESTRARSLFSGLLHDVEDIATDSISKILALLKGAEEESSELAQGMHVSIADVAELRHQIDEVYDGLERRNSDFKDLQVRDLKYMESSHDMTLYLQASLNDLQKRVAGVDGALEWLVERFAAIHQQESLILKKLQTFETHLEKFDKRAAKLFETQTYHAKAIEVQAQAQEALGTNTKVVYAMLEKATARAANLESMLEDTASRFKGLQELDGPFGLSISLWTLLSLLVTLLIVQNPQTACVLLIFAGLWVGTRAISYITPFLSAVVNRYT